MNSTITGNTVKAIHNNISYTVYTEDYVKGEKVPCIVEYSEIDRNWRVSLNGTELSVRYVICDLKGIAAHDTD